MCRSIKSLFNFDPPATDQDVQAASLQFVRKLSGFAHPSKVNEKAFDRAAKDVSRAARRLLNSLQTSAAPRNRAQMEAAARARWEASKRD